MGLIRALQVDLMLALGVIAATIGGYLLVRALMRGAVTATGSELTRDDFGAVRFWSRWITGVVLSLTIIALLCRIFVFIVTNRSDRSDIDLNAAGVYQQMDSNRR